LNKELFSQSSLNPIVTVCALRRDHNCIWLCRVGSRDQKRSTCDRATTTAFSLTRLRIFLLNVLAAWLSPAMFQTMYPCLSLKVPQVLRLTWLGITRPNPAVDLFAERATGHFSLGLCLHKRTKANDEDYRCIVSYAAMWITFCVFNGENIAFNQRGTHRRNSDVQLGPWG
jgi:hypothetical protein